VIVDLGTGDARAVLTRATDDQRAFVIGIDANAASMAEASRRASRGRTRVVNACFIAASAESLPGHLAAVASLVTITMPWGSLLRGALGMDARAMTGIASIVAPAGRIVIVTSVVQTDQVANLEMLDERASPAFEAAWRSAGFELVSMRPVTGVDLRATRSSWARRLGERPVWRLEVRNRATPRAHAQDGGH
jgi:16S rRNA (adenine(1408)-N(1))-methyltransferase